LSAAAIHRVLEDVVTGESRICYIDAIKGTLLYRGYDVEELVQKSTYEEVAYLLLYGNLPKKVELDRFKQELMNRCAVPNQVLTVIGSFPAERNAMDMLRTAVSALSLYDVVPNDPLKQSMSIIAKMPNLISAVYRQKEGEWFVPLRKDLSLAATFLYSSYGTEPDPQDSKVLDALLILHADHELNASTFTARVAASTLSDVYSAVTGAVGALKGPLHGGANEKVIEMTLEIGNPENAESYVDALLAKRQKITGFGHRVYKTMDPRARILKDMARKFVRSEKEKKVFQILEKTEEMMKTWKNMYPNVDLYSGLALNHVGIPSYLFTPVFAVGRAPGWLAHILEQYADNRLIRPRAEYMGPQRAVYVPLEQRTPVPVVNT
jgi:citrate synthase